MNGILYVLETGCTWTDVPRKYGTKSTVHRFHFYLCEHGIYQEIFNDLLNKGYDLKKIDLSHCFTDTKDIAAKKRGNIGYDRYKKIKGVKLSFLVDLNGFPLSLSIAPANQYDSKLYISTLENFKIKRHIGRPVNRPSMISADAAYDTTEIREYNRRRGIKPNIPVNERNKKKNKSGRPIKVDKKEHRKKNAIERFFGWIESCKKVLPRYETKEISDLGIVIMAVIVRLHQVLG